MLSPHNQFEYVLVKQIFADTSKISTLDTKSDRGGTHNTNTSNRFILFRSKIIVKMSCCINCRVLFIGNKGSSPVPKSVKVFTSKICHNICNFGPHYIYEESYLLRFNYVASELT